jgi:hypothetical protein
MKKLVVAFSLISFVMQSQNMLFQWSKGMNGTGGDMGEAIAVDATGNVYTIGTFGGTVDFDPGPATFTLASAGIGDIFLSKLDALGNFIWAKRIGGVSNETGKSIKLDASGNIFFTGSFVGSVDFDPGPGSSVGVSNGNSDVFICKLDASGNFLWARKHGSTNYDAGFGINVDASGNVYTTGVFIGTVDFDPGVGTYTLTSPASNFDGFVSKLDASGNFVWAVSFGSNGSEYGRSVYVDATNVYVTGEFQNTVDFDPGVGVTNIVANGTYDFYVLKLNLAGAFVWAKGLGGIGNEFGYDISVDPSGNVYTTGVFAGTSDFDPGVGVSNLISSGWDVFVSKLNSLGNFVWAKKMGGAGYDAGNGVFADANNVYVTGSFEQTSDFDPNAGTSTITSTGLGDIFISKLDASGNFVWAGGIGDVNADEGKAIKVDGVGNVYSTGLFQGTMDFDPNSGTFTLTSGGQSDIYVHKMNPCIAPASPTNSTTGANQSLCSGNSTTLNAIGSGTLSWYSTASSTIALATGTTFVTPSLSAGNYTYYAQALTCGISLSRTAITITVAPTPTINISSTHYVLCSGITASLLVSGATSYTWDTGATTNTLAVSPTVTTIYTVTGLSAFCSSNTTLSITVINIPTITISTSAGTICPGGTTTLTINGSAASYSWNTGDTTTSIVVSPTANTTYTAAGFNGICYGVATTGILISNSITVSASANNPIICSGESTTITVTGAATYTWDTGSNSISIVVNPTTTTSYSVGGANGNCSGSATTSIVVNPCVGIYEFSKDLHFSIYPNPNTGSVFIETETESDLKITNVLGQVVFENKLYSGKNTINLKEFATGVYYFSVKEGENLRTSKILKN